VASAFVFVFTSGWCLARLAERNASNLGGLMFTGPGAGIAISGVLASGMVALQWKAAAGWLIFGVLACVLTAMTWRTFGMKLVKPMPLTNDSATPTHHVQTSLASRWHMFWLAIAYGLDGLGYIITATFLPGRSCLAQPGWTCFGRCLVWL